MGCDATGSRERRYVYGKTKADVQKKLYELRSAAATGSLASPNKMRIADYLKHWLDDVARPMLRKTTAVGYEGIIRLHISPHIGGIQVTNLQPSQVQRMYSDLEEKGVSPRTREYAHAVLRKALNNAVKLGYAQRNVCTLVTKPRVPKKAMRCWTENQSNQFLETAKDDRLFALYVLALATGLRQGELFGLQWSDIDFQDGSLSVQRTTYELSGKIEIGETKTAKGRRRVELPLGALKVLKHHREKMFAEGHHQKWVFCDTSGGPLRRSNFRKRSLIPLLKKSNLPEIRFHDFRHTAATLLLGAGVHPKIVQERLGHAQIAITLDTYSHVLPSMQKEAAAKIDTILKVNF
jgi:integrase